MPTTIIKKSFLVSIFAFSSLLFSMEKDVSGSQDLSSVLRQLQKEERPQSQRDLLLFL
jgi:hypothetical protein